MCVDVFAIIHYRLEQKSGFQFQFQTWSRMNSTSSLLELSFILAGAAFIACLVTVAKSFSWDQYTVIIFTSHTGNVVPCLEGEFVSTWAVTVILIVNYWGGKQKGGKKKSRLFVWPTYYRLYTNPENRGPAWFRTKWQFYKHPVYRKLNASHKQLAVLKGHSISCLHILCPSNPNYSVWPRKLALISSEKWEFWLKKSLVPMHISQSCSDSFSTSKGRYNT